MSLQSRWWQFKLIDWPMRRYTFERWGHYLRWWYWRYLKWPLVGPKALIGDGHTDDTEAMQFILDRDGYLHGNSMPDQNVPKGTYNVPVLMVSRIQSKPVDSILYLAAPRAEDGHE